MNHAELRPEEKALLSAIRETGGPSEVQRARVRRGLGAKLAAGATIPVVAATSALAMAGKIGAGIVLVATVGAGTAYWNHARSARTAPRAPTPIAIPSATVTPTPTAPIDLPVAVPEEASPAPVETASPATIRRSPRVKSAVPRPEQPAALASDLAQEIALLGQANAATKRGEVSRAAELLGDYDRRFPAGKLAEERAAADILLLCASGRASDAKTKARRFVERWPRSPLLVPLQVSCAQSSLVK